MLIGSHIFLYAQSSSVKRKEKKRRGKEIKEKRKPSQGCFPLLWHETVVVGEACAYLVS